MTDRIIELAKQVMTEACEHFGKDAPPKAELDLIHDEPETQWYLQRLAELVRNDAVDATCQDSRHVPGCVDAGMQAAPMQAQFTDDELDLFRQWYNSVQDTNGGYLVELDHALFRKLRAIKEAPVQEPDAFLHDDGYWTAAKTDAGRGPNDRLHFAGSTKVAVFTAPQPAPVQVQQKMGKEYIDRLIDSLLLPMGAMLASDVAELHNQCAQMLLLCSKAQPRTAVKLSDSEIASDASRHWSEDGVDPIAFAHAIESAVWAKNGWTE